MIGLVSLTTMTLAAAEGTSRQMISSVVIFFAILAAVAIGARPLMQTIRQKEAGYDLILNRALLLNIPPRVVTVLTFLAMFVMGATGYLLLSSLVAALLLGTVGLMVPGFIIRILRTKRQVKLEEQLVAGIQMLASGVRAGLNLVQSMQMIARDAPNPMRQEFAHLVQEYEYGIPLDQAMHSASVRVGSSDYQLLFAALHTHRERGGNLGETLDRIAESIREIQRLEGRVKTLTAQGRATARWLGAMPGVVMGILYLIEPEGVEMLFTETVGNILLAIVVVLNVIGFLWIRKTMDIDI